MESRFNKPSFYLLSSAIDGNENAIKKLLFFMIPIYQNVVYVHSMINMEMYILS